MREKIQDTFDGVRELRRSGIQSDLEEAAKQGPSLILVLPDGTKKEVSSEAIKKVVDKVDKNKDHLGVNIVDKNPHNKNKPNPAGPSRRDPEDYIIDPWNSGYPYSACGRFHIKRSCSMTLIGRRLALTAMHCGTTGKVYPSFYDKKVKGRSTKVVAAYHDERYTPNVDGWELFDWVILVLDWNIGDNFGYMGVAANVKTEWVGDPAFRNVAYPFEIMEQKRPDAYGAPGSSGSSLWFEDEDKNAIVVSVVSSLNVTAKTVNVAGHVGPSELAERALYAATEWPAE
ncbi:Uu.00g075670.m01.CDS01 [Anthostomella pinea]|uniref:Uu.00g075670.m01.CDS01 n=1 Tax=Anthostomella pinea TaxID=933095 RepID=A0AAI8YLS0_9PEZI|nr:Uu.00g075670.m01.CDS01 [Anthostomella pinea]